MKRIIRNSLSMVGLLVATQLWGQDTVLSFSAERLLQCQQQNNSLPRNTVREALKRKDYLTALSSMVKPGKSTSAEQRYLYGKLQYLLAYEQVSQHQTEKPDVAVLASATKHIETAAKLGLAEALYDQAMLLTPDSDQPRQLELLRLAADKQHAPAMLQLAEEYFLSSQTYEKRVEAQAILQKAAELDSSAKIKLAQYYLHEDQRLTNTTGYDYDVDKAINLFHEVALACDGRGAYWLYEMAKFKNKPNSLDPETAIDWLTIASELGLPKAQGELAEYYFKTEPNMTKAIRWSEQATDKDNLTGIIVLAKLYYHGKGVDRDHGKALQYFEQALKLDNDNRAVQDQLGMMYYKGEGVDADFRKAAEFCKVAANKGQAGCQYYLGLMYVNGEGVTQDIDRGINWMRRSAAQDFSIAKNWLRENW